MRAAVSVNLKWQSMSATVVGCLLYSENGLFNRTSSMLSRRFIDLFVYDFSASCPAEALDETKTPCSRLTEYIKKSPTNVI